MQIWTWLSHCKTLPLKPRMSAGLMQREHHLSPCAFPAHSEENVRFGNESPQIGPPSLFWDHGQSWSVRWMVRVQPETLGLIRFNWTQPTHLALVFLPQEEIEVLVHDGRVEGHVLISSCESIKIATSYWTVIDRRMSEKPPKKKRGNTASWGGGVKSALIKVVKMWSSVWLCDEVSFISEGKKHVCSSASPAWTPLLNWLLCPHATPSWCCWITAPGREGARQQ